MFGEEQVEDDAFEDTLKYLELLAAQENFDISQVEAELRAVQKYEGLDWTGRGALKAAEISGAIMAYQAFIMRYKKSTVDH
jgi:hypothetical protein